MQAQALRSWTAGEESRINREFCRVFGVGRSLDEWRWKFFSPAGGPFVLAAWEGEVLLAHTAAIVHRWQAFGEPILAAQVVDVFSKPSARRSLAAGRLFLQTMEELFRQLATEGNCAFVYGFPSAKPLALYQRGRVAEQVAGEPMQYCRDIPQRATLLPPLGVEMGSSFLAVEELWMAVAGRVPLAVIRSADYLRYRYGPQAPHTYRFFAAYRGENLAAWTVVRAKGDRLFLAELLWDGEDTAYLEKLLVAVERHGAHLGLRRLELWCTGDPLLANALGELGWRATPHPEVALVVRSFQPTLPVETIARGIFLTLGDSDLI
ncbi:MAG: GNAT family N-acetyltransferase [Thermoanaerobaculaceae bacterium]